MELLRGEADAVAVPKVTFVMQKASVRICFRPLRTHIKSPESVIIRTRDSFHKSGVISGL
jgi:hypothetical protein